ncbi:MAG TPA: endopeptidase La [Verrucomicrobia bacterium]|nr:endopeptidase La [Verrucomicrobiota bacterium]
MAGKKTEDKKGESRAEESAPDAVMHPDGAEKTIVLARDLMPAALPIIPLHDRPVFPKMTIPMMVDAPDIARMLIDRVDSKARYVGLVLQKPQEPSPTNPSPDGEPPALYEVGTVAEIMRMAKSDSGNEVQVILTVLQRFRITELTQTKPHIVARVEYLTETEMTDHQDLKAYSLSVVRCIKELIQLNPLYKEELSIFMVHSNLQDPGRLCDFAAALTTSTPVQLQEILETVRIRERLQKVLVLLKHELDITQVQARISSDIEKKMNRTQREFFLREQLKAIKKELGIEKEGKETEVERFQKRIAELKLPAEAAERINEELEKLKLIEPASPEFTVTRNYLEWLTSLPWGISTSDRYDIAKAESILNDDHFGLNDVKERILEFLAVGILKGSVSGSILCFVGPPGVGKTSIGRSIARSIKREFYRFSLGGMRDEAEIKGHRRTYIGAMPGKFIQAIKTCKSANPVIMLDEVDKIGASFHGDPASALLEVLDPEQNREFLDHYLDVRFDLSNVFFICTANQLDTIPRPLLDRMEVIKLAGYILEEKLEIARQYLIPKQLEAHGLTRKQVTLSGKALREMIDGYAREPGVRGLENHIKKIMRKLSREIVKDKAKKIKVDAKDVVRYLGQRQFLDENISDKPRAGIVTGLAWTSMGGDTLFIEAIKIKTGKSGFKQTGQLGDVMVESTEIAYAYLRATMNENEPMHQLFESHIIHLHVPAGATPKDGPSAGITMATAIYSLIHDKPVRSHLAMTGELTLTGRVMPIGGVKEKTIAAKRADIKLIIFPEANRKDFDELPDHIKRGLKPYFVRTFDDVIEIAFKG